VLALIAPNGLGHFRRQVGILGRLLDERPGLRLHVLCAEAQIRAARDWDRSARLFADARVTRQSGVLDPGVVWATAPSRYEDGSLLAWVDRLDQVPALSGARLVVSDNLAAVLTRRPDAILAGSFLWGDVLTQAYARNRAVRAFADLEAGLLAAHRPAMLCVRDIVMPAVRAQTRAVELGWMCESPRLAVEPVPRRVGVLGGATGAAHDLLRRAARALARTGAWQLALPGPADDAVPFHHEAADYAALSVAVCRPGVGTVADCVAQGVPMVTLHEGPVNPELAHNGARLAALGVAIDLGADPSDDAIVAAVARAAEPPTAAAMRARLGALPRDGLREAVAYLAQRLEAA
jgi:hypothetical protein